MKCFSTISTISLITLLAAALTGCHNPEQPRLRISSYFGSVTGMDFVKPEDLGKHNYASQWNEKNGMVYTCRGGFIDLGHLREAADRTRYAAGLVYKSIMGGRRDFTFRVIEPSVYRLSIAYPADWYRKTLAERQAIARDVSLKLGQQIGHTTLIWHEMITWFGWASTGVFSEQISSFSWEDTYSDVLGTSLAVKAMQTDKPFNDAMTDVIDQTLQELQVQSPETARKAYKQIEGKWFKGGLYFFVKMNKRNFDIGLENGNITPWLVADICPGTRPTPWSVPHPQAADLRGFSVRLTLNPNVHEKSKIYRIMDFENDRWLTPAEDFPVLMDKIIEQAKHDAGPQVDTPYTHHVVMESNTYSVAGRTEE